MSLTAINAVGKRELAEPTLVAVIAVWNRPLSRHLCYRPRIVFALSIAIVVSIAPSTPYLLCVAGRTSHRYCCRHCCRVILVLYERTSWILGSE